MILIYNLSSTNPYVISSGYKSSPVQKIVAPYQANSEAQVQVSVAGQIETMTDYAKGFGAKGLAYIKVEGGEWKSPIVKFFNDTEKAALTSKLKIEEGDLILFAADQWLTACEILGRIRLYCADVLKEQGKLTIPADRFDFLWVVDFPLLSFDKEQNRWYSSHHPFTAPVAEDVEDQAGFSAPGDPRHGRQDARRVDDPIEGAALADLNDALDWLLTNKSSR